MTDSHAEDAGDSRSIREVRRLATEAERHRTIEILRAAKTPAAVVQLVEQGASVAKARAALGTSEPRQCSGVWPDVTRRLNERGRAKAAETEADRLDEAAK